jgi:uncharacterized protein
MFTKLTDSNKAAIFSVLVLCMAVGAALLIRMLGLTPGYGMFALWMSTPTVATLVMLLAVTREGYSKEGWKSLGLHRLGLNVWWIAFGVTLFITVAASAVVWATPLASFVLPEGGILNPLIGFLMLVGVYTLTLLSSGRRRRALALSGLVWATWHMPLIFLAPAVNFPTGNLLLFFPLFYGTVVAASFIFGYLRIYTGSIWPASIGHSVHNAAWGVLAAFTLTASPVLVNVYLVGDFGLLILIGTVFGAIWVGHRFKSGMDEAQPGTEVPEVAPVAPAATAAPTR